MMIIKQMNLNFVKKPLILVFVAIVLFIAQDFIVLSPNFTKFVDNTIRSMFIYAFVWVMYLAIEPFYKLINKKQSALEKLVVKIIKIFMVIIGFITISQEWGYNVSGFLASLGLLGMAFALAAKDTVANLFGSFVIFTDKPFKVGDWIKTSDIEGVVEDIDIRSTKIRTFAQALVTVPNATLANSAILNWSAMGKRRIKINIGLTYDTTVTQLQKIINDIKFMLKKHPDIHQDVIHVYFSAFEDSSLNIFCYYFTKTTSWDKFMKVREDTYFKIMQIIKDNGSSFAFPSRSVYLNTV
jgi:MscS family membrane protein